MLDPSIRVIPVSAFKDNYIWFIVQLKTRQCAIVDPGTAKPVLAALHEHNLIPTAILITHHHWDHNGGIEDLLQYMTIPVYGPARETIPHCDHPLQQNDSISINELKFNVLDIPGHTAGHIAYYGHGMLFCGDTLFTGGCGRVFEGTAQQMVNSLDKLAALLNETLVYCGHEYTQANLKFAATIEPNNPDLLARIQETAQIRQQNLPTVPAPLSLEKLTNPFLRVEVPSVIKAAEAYSGQSLPDKIAVFTTLRAWKNNF